MVTKKTKRFALFIKPIIGPKRKFERFPNLTFSTRLKAEVQKRKFKNVNDKVFDFKVKEVKFKGSKREIK